MTTAEIIAVIMLVAVVVLRSTDADIIALQKTKMNTLLPEPFLSSYDAVWNGGERPGYSGTACLYNLYKRKPEISH